ncbi:MAG TPA: ACT domain-containing protein [Candidatus Omnitrophica bacterium]|nr:ACT domain-containing protein [Candidatus Omnitrophota bacterium]
MKLKQISVFLENKKGRLHEVCDILGKNDINIRALTIAESEDFGVLRMIVDKPEQTLEILREKGFVVRFSDIVAVEVEDKPGGLAEVLKVLRENDINVEYMYGFVEKKADKALVVFRFDEPDKVVNVLKENGIGILEELEGL